MKTTTTSVEEKHKTIESLAASLCAIKGNPEISVSTNFTDVTFLSSGAYPKFIETFPYILTITTTLVEE